MGFMDKIRSGLSQNEDNTEQPKREKPIRFKKDFLSTSKKNEKIENSNHQDDVEESEESIIKGPVFTPKNNDSAFALDEDDDFFSKQQKKYEEEMKEYENLPELSVREKRVQDVLEVLDIPPTFNIEKDVFLPDDIADITFDLQTPYGFEQGQVMAFVDRTRITVKRYVDLLTLRNQHIAQLATMIDKLQVNANNLRFQNEIANGINIMPTTENDDLENKYMESLLTIKKLEDALKQANLEINNNSQQLSSQERENYELLQDQVAVLRRDKSHLEEEVYNLKNRLAYLEEMSDDEEEVRNPYGEDLSHGVIQMEEFGTEEENIMPMIVTEDEEDYKLPTNHSFSLPVPEEIITENNKKSFSESSKIDYLEEEEIDTSLFFDQNSNDTALDNLLEEAESNEVFEFPEGDQEHQEDMLSSSQKHTENSAFLIDDGEDKDDSEIVLPKEAEKIEIVLPQENNNHDKLLHEEDNEDDDELSKLMADWKQGE